MDERYGVLGVSQVNYYRLKDNAPEGGGFKPHPAFGGLKGLQTMNVGNLQSLTRLFKEESLAAVLTRQAVGGFIVKTVGSVISFGMHVLLARSLGADSYGDYVYPLAWMSFLSLVSMFGLDTATLRFVSAYQADGDMPQLRGFLRWSWLLTIGFSVCTALATALIVYLIRRRIETDLMMSFFATCLLLPFATVVQLGGARLRALKEVILGKALVEIVRPLLIGGLLSLVLLLGQTISAPQAILLNLVATGTGVLILQYMFHKAIGGSLKGVEPIYRIREWRTVALPLLVVSGFSFAMTKTDVLAVGAFLSTTEAAIYGAANRVGILILFGLSGVNAIAAPMISELYSQGRMEELQRMITWAGRGILIFVSVVFVITVFAGRFILTLFGPEFADGYIVLLILSVGQVINALAGPAGYFMSMTGHQREQACVMGLVALVNILLDVVLIPTLGAFGAAIATALVNATWNLTFVVYIKLKTGINMTAFPFPVALSGRSDR